MVLEAVMLCLDNSEYMRNGDYPPSRLDVQGEASNYIASLKNQANIENSIGVLTMAGKRVDVLLTPSSDLGNILSALNGIRCDGQSNFVSALKTAQLCLKNRSNKNQRQRIILFVGSPIASTTKELVKLGKHLKKHNVAVDVINFGLENTENDNTEKLDAFIQSVTSDNNSKMVVIPPGPHNFVDMIVTTIMADEQGNAPPAPGAFGDGIDPTMDPELAEAIRLSLEAEREREQKMEVDQSASSNAPAVDAPASPKGTSGEAAPVAPVAGNVDEEMDEETAMALAMSMEQFDKDGDVVMKETGTSTTTTAPAEVKTEAKIDASADIGKALQDPNFVDDLLSDLNIPKDQVDIDDILNSLNDDAAKKNDKPKDGKDENKKQ